MLYSRLIIAEPLPLMQNEMKKTSISLSVLILFLLLLFSTNPNQNQFKEYIETQLIEDSQKEDFFTRLADKILSGPTAWTINAFTDRADYGFFSIYSSSLFNQEVIYIGVLNNFIRIQ